MAEEAVKKEDKRPEKVKPDRPMFAYRFEKDINGKIITESEIEQIDYTREKGYHLVPRTRRLT